MARRECGVPKKCLENKKSETDCILEQNFINYFSVPSMENIAILSVMTSLWKQTDIIDAIRQYSTKFNPILKRSSSLEGKIESLSQIEEKFLEKVSLLPWPNELIAKAAFFIKPIIIEVLKWMCDDSNRYNNCHRRFDYMDCIHWTMEGTIDKVKTLKSELRYKHFEAYTQRDAFYKACQYCLEYEIINLWIKLPKEIRKDLCIKSVHKEYKDHLVTYWVRFVVNKLTRFLNRIKNSDNFKIKNLLLGVYKNMFILSLSEGNSVAVKYFWNKLTQVEINDNFLKWTDNVIRQKRNDTINYGYPETNEHTDILFFMLSKMNDKEQLRNVFFYYSDDIFNAYFSDWPWKKFLLPTVRVVWDYLHEDVYIRLLSLTSKQIKAGRCSIELLKELWCDSPIKFKEHYIKSIIKYDHDSEILWELFEIEDLEVIRLILKAANKEEKKQFIFRSMNGPKLRKIIYAEKLMFFVKLIEETLSLECDINTFKKQVICGHGRYVCHAWIHDGNLQAVGKFFDWGNVSEDPIDNLKKKLIDAVEIAHSLIPQGNYKLVNKFMHWYFSTEEEVEQFKKAVAYEMRNDYGIVEHLSGKDWASFKRFLDWCFNSEEEINQFRLYISMYDRMVSIISHTILSSYNYIFATELLNWCLSRNEEVRKFKKEFILSKDGSDLLERFKSNYLKTEYIYWKSVKKLIQWFHPLDMEVNNVFKEEVKRILDINFARSKLYTTKRRKQKALSQSLRSLSLDELNVK